MNSLTINGIKLCKACYQNKPLSEFPIKRKGDKPSYGKCKQCTDVYEFNRRRLKGIPIRKEKKLTVKPVIHDVKAVNRMKAVKRYKAAHPYVTHVCMECNVLFEGSPKRKFCTIICGDKYHRRILKKRIRARMRTLKVDNVDPIKVFKEYKWHCAYCNVHTPRHLKGKHVDNSPELDHIIPLSKNGEHSYVNVQLLCRQCNLRKLDSINYSVLNNTKFQYEMFPNMGGHLSGLPK